MVENLVLGWRRAFINDAVLDAERCGAWLGGEFGLQSEFGAVHHSFGNDSLESNGVRSISVDRDFDLLGRQIRLFSVESQVGR